jgi:sugar O-acyltransferase (sialic acid O-acetyltransferase NeuD family)
MENPVIIFGAGGIGKAALEIFQSNEVVVYCFLDDNEKLHGQEINDISILGSTDDDGYLKLIGKKCEAFIAVDESKYRQSLVKMLNERRHVMPVNAIHNTATISSMAAIGHGNFINSRAIIGAYAKVGSHCMIHSGAIIDFEAELADFVQVGAGAVVNAGVKIGKNVFIGAGATIIAGVEIGKNARIGAGSVVISNIKDGETVFGNPAKTVG